ncbi:MAG: ABC transporter ATP-binding protein [Kiritimatiellae bacterium]|nr:ABC transporter ATP-binding protein [Kiritimatiellia bacterium]
MPDEEAIVVAHIGKRFRLRERAQRTLKGTVLDLIGSSAGRRSREFWALRHVNFGVTRGETLGVIGANGAGKSTLLALIAGTMTPTEGRVEVRGMVSSLLELGAGFHPDLTGRENVFLYGSIMGLSRRQMRERFEAIVDFAELADFIDQPVKHYSSGMYVRLGFAVAVEVDPDILLVDEVLAVGDENFRRKCMARMSEFRERGKTMLVISHDLDTIQKVSDRILLLDQGRIVDLGMPESVVKKYQTSVTQRMAHGVRREWGNGEALIEDVRIRNESGVVAETFRSGDSVRIEIVYNALRRIENPVFGYAVSDESGRIVSGSNTQIEGFTVPAIEGTGTLHLHIDGLSLAKGAYFLSFSLHSADHKTHYHRLDNYFPVWFDCERDIVGCCRFACRWEMGGATPGAA